MEIIAHRGYWKSIEEKNTIKAMNNAFAERLGVETDFRDRDEKLKVSHNMSLESCLDAEEFFKLYKNSPFTLALNIKADGIQIPLKKLILKYNIKEYFCFDMSVPDTLGYIKEELNFFTRESEYESVPSFYDKAAGVWLDGFISDDWITSEKVIGHINKGKKVCIVSPELHGREYRAVWKKYKEYAFQNNDQIILCTDYPVEARSFFYE